MWRQGRHTEVRSEKRSKTLNESKNAAAKRFGTLPGPYSLRRIMRKMDLQV
jgi:hypothetical protein